MDREFYPAKILSPFHHHINHSWHGLFMTWTYAYTPTLWPPSFTNLLLIGVDPSSDDLLVLSSQPVQALSLTDLFKLGECHVQA